MVFCFCLFQTCPECAVIVQCYHNRTCRINPQCQSMKIRLQELIPIWINKDHCRSILINKGQFYSINLIKVNANQCGSISNTYASDPVLICNDPHWSLLSKIDLYWLKLISNDLYWAKFWINSWNVIFIDWHWGMIRHDLPYCIMAHTEGLNRSRITWQIQSPAFVESLLQQTRRLWC